MGLWNKWKTIDARLRIFIMLAIIGLECWFLVYMSDQSDERKAKRAEYITAHKCERNGFAGKNAVPVYKCDNGMWLEHELAR